MAAPFRSLGCRLLRKPVSGVNFPGNSIFSQIAPTAPVTPIQILPQVAPASFMATRVSGLSSKTGLYKYQCQGLFKAPFRYGNTTSCPLTDGLSFSSRYKTPRAELKPDALSQRLQNLKISTAPQGPTPEAIAWRKKVKKYLADFLSKLRQSIWIKIENELIEWLLFCIGSSLVLLASGLGIAIFRLFGINLPKKDDDNPADAENSAMLKSIEDLLQKKDGRASFLEKACEIQSERVRTLLEINNGLRKENEYLRAALAAYAKDSSHQ